MVEKLKKISTKQIVMFSVLAFMLVLVIGTTYAYFTAKVIGNDEAKNTQVYAGIMSLKLDGTQELNANNMLPGATKEVEFSIENTGTLTTTYELDMKEVYNDFANKEDLVYTLEQDGKSITTEAEAPATNEILIPAVVIEPNEIQTYKLKLTFKEMGTNQNNNQNKTFTGKIQISGIDSSNYLQAKVLARSINTNEPDYESPDPVAISNEKVLEDHEVSVNSLVVNGNRSIGDGYKYNKNSGLYTLTNVKKNQTFNKSTIGKYACENNVGKCTTMYKINDVKESEAKENYSQNIEENVTVSYTSSSDKAVAENFHLDQETGYFILENLSEIKSYDSSDVGKYTCNIYSTSGQCTTMYKINRVTDTTVNNVDTYSRSTNYNAITKADQYGSTSTSVLTNESGLYKTEDDDGESYYFRGKIDNNYVSFANNLWRIVRINGDGSIRLIHASSIGNNKYNGSQWPIDKEVGYTYDNESECTKESPCISDYNKETATFVNNKTVTDSVVKTYLEEWYINNLKDYDDKINLSNFCNDTTTASTGSSKCYGSYNRVMINATPTLKCPNTKETYGGNYKLKIGLLTADEGNYAGLNRRSTYITSKVANKTNYLYYGKYWFSMTPSCIRWSLVFTNTMYSGAISSVGIAHYIRPVINLKSDIQITKGDGSQTNPYIVE